MSFLREIQYWLAKQLTCTNRLNTCIDDMIMLREDLTSKDSEVSTQKKIISDMASELEKLKSQPVPVEDPLKEAREYWDTKYPKRDITYGGRYFPFDKTKKIEIDVRMF